MKRAIVVTLYRHSLEMLLFIVLLCCSQTVDEPTRTSVRPFALINQIGISDCPDGYNIIQGTVEDDFLEGTAENDCILGFEGDDIIHGGSGDDYIAGGPGDDEIVSENGKDSIFGEEGDDIIIAGNGIDSEIYGGDGNDWIEASNGQDSIIYCGNGDDFVIGGNGKDTIFGGNGNDRIYGVNGKDILYGDECHDIVIGGLAPDIVDGCDGYDACDGINCERSETEIDNCSQDSDCSEGYWCIISIGLCVLTEVAPNIDITCDNIDDDCNGEVDEDYPPEPTTCGIGACAAAGIMKCVNGSEIDTCIPGNPSLDDASCDAIDDDCDGETDEDCQVCSFADWESIESLPVPLNIAGSTEVWEGKIFVLGGANNIFGSNWPYSRHVYEYTIETDQYRDLGEILPYGMNLKSWNIALADNDKFYISPVIGTTQSGGWGSHSRIVEFDPLAETAMEKASFGTTLWDMQAVNGGNGYIYFIGAWNGGSIPLIWQYNPDQDSVVEVASIPKPGNSLSGVIKASNGLIYSWGNGHSSSVLIFDPSDFSVRTVIQPCANVSPIVWEVPTGVLWGFCDGRSKVASFNIESETFEVVDLGSNIYYPLAPQAAYTVDYENETLYSFGGESDTSSQIADALRHNCLVPIATD